MLLRIDFNADLLAAVQDFNCGEKPWEKEVSDWLRSPLGTGGALDDILNLGTRVWLYQEPEGSSVVGFGSLGVHVIRYKNPKKGTRTPTFVIPGVGLARAFWGKPKAPKRSYSRQIMDDIFQTARNSDVVPKIEIIMLVVHKENMPAIHLYREYRFEDHGAKDANYNRMVAVL